MENGSHKRVLQALRDSQEEMVRTLEELTNIDSPSTDKTHMDRFSAALAAKWKENGATVHTIEHDKYGNHLKAEWGDGEGQVPCSVIWIPSGPREKRLNVLSGSKTEKATDPGHTT